MTRMSIDRSEHSFEQIGTEVEDAGLAGRLLDGIEREREVLARALHDELGSNLTAINLDVASVAGQLPDGVARTRLERALRVLKEAVELKRRLIQSLRPSMIDSLGLVATLRMEAEAFEARSGVVCAARFDEEPAELDPRVAMAVYRLVQECTRRLDAAHGATALSIALTAEGPDLRLVVESDAAEGLDPIGLQTMQARVRHLGGRCEATTGAAGLRLVAVLPVTPSARSR